MALTLVTRSDCWSRIKVMVVVVRVKARKINDGIEFKINNYKKVLLNHWEYLPKIFLSSSVKHIGRDNILQYIEKINATVTEK